MDINHRKPLKICFLLIITLFVVSACSGGTEMTRSDQDLIEKGVAATLTKEAFLDSIDSARQTEEVTEEQDVGVDQSSGPSATPSQTPSPEPEHVTTPGSPPRQQVWISDMVTVDLAKDKTALGDNYSWSRLERPYTAEGMEYVDYLDIYQVDLQVTDPWVYVTIILIGDLPYRRDVRYSVELDIDHDGRGDYLVMAILPPDAEWTTDGVLVLEDQDQDIGGPYPLYMDDANPGVNGYETELFSSGIGEDGDLAWVRRDPSNANQIQITFKDSLIGNIGFLWSAWADEGLRDPALFDYNDHFSFEEAGSPNKDNFRYPVKAVAMVDSTCRMWYGYIPVGFEPGLCFSQEQAVKPAGFGWCLPAATDMGCSGKCVSVCPKDRVCVPCKR